jgi:shikimate dehydrogenase
MMEETAKIKNTEKRIFYFIGVTTQKSSIMQLFPRWMQILGREEVVIEGIDLKIHDHPEAYRQVVKQVKDDPQVLGALVTTHKIDLLQAAQDLFDDLDEYAQLCQEISSISKVNGRLQGHAKDPISSGLSLQAILSPGYFGQTGGHGLFFGAGGSASATLLHLIKQTDSSDRPAVTTLVDRLPERLAMVRSMVERVGADMQIKYICNEDPMQNDLVLGALPPGSLVVNATGMGKDTPGSPVTSAGFFPRQGVAWEFNYRGELDFLHQARAQSQSRQLRIEDGWLYFLHGWTQVIAQVLHLELTPELFEKLKITANEFRST